MDTAAADLARDLAQELIRCPSVTPEDAGALDVLQRALKTVGFRTERLRFEDEHTPSIDNLLASVGAGAPHLMLTGHTDVVPAGATHDWQFDPFSGAIDAGRLHGRGAVDMKGGLACLTAAAITHVRERGGWPDGAGTLSFLVTGDEEGPAINGTRKLLAWAFEHGYRFDAAVLAEPTTRHQIGDTIKIGRRGSLSGKIAVSGTQGHVAYPHLADNPMPLAISIATALNALELDNGNAHFEPSNLEITSIDTANTAYNVIPARVGLRFNIRHSTEHDAESLARLVDQAVRGAAGDAYDAVDLTFLPNPAEAFLTAPGPLVDLMSAAVQAVTGLTPDLTTGGGTSDARFIKDYCPVIEIGLLGQTMHQVNENTELADLDRLTHIFSAFLERYFRAADA
ncbi:MAG: succinyl-diaminopimelate desuccinylase [Pseudomonadota bacterium]